MENSKTLLEKRQDLSVHPKEVAERLANGDFIEPKPIAPVYPIVSHEELKVILQKHNAFVEKINLKNSIKLKKLEYKDLQSFQSMRAGIQL